MTPRLPAGLALAALLLAGCGNATSAPVADVPEPSLSNPSASPTASGTRPLEGFPLASGYPETNGDDGSPVVVSTESGVRDIMLCGRPAWAPDLLLPPVDLIGTTYTGEAEDIRGRTLVRYEDEQLAAKALAMLRLAVERCPEGEAGGTAQVYTAEFRYAGAGAFTITHRYRGEQGFHTGLEVIDAVQVGDLLLVSSTYGEGGGSAETIEAGQREATDQSDALLPWLCEYAVPACAVREPVPVVQVGPDGIEDVTLGMSAEDAAAVGLLGEPRHDGSGCTVTTREEETHSITADIRPGVGVVTLSVHGTDSVTPEGVGTGAPAADIYRAYPGAAQGDEPKVSAPVPGRPEAAYWFWLDKEERVTEVMLLLPDERCLG